ncbi:hypothetical protein A5739_08820 [Mycobacterium colombiense]|uniref:hypothetical protein n=1 Tax=Mycobacterium colombiense TaxID=339268 RepID=UPI00096E7E1C|nr:hypothetical protein [Mycobacterium colombiense]OMC33433.1 hypothetical protein A5739_08820 [Mycobacterium colombiense]
MTHPSLMSVHPMLVAQNAATNRYYQRAIESVGGENYTRACQLRAAASQMRMTLPPITPQPPPADADALPGWLTDAVAATTATWERAAKLEALTNLIGECDRNIGGIASNTDALCRSLADDLAQLMDSVAAVVDELKGARTPAQVIDLGVADAWKKLPTLRTEYDRIRAAQELVMAREAEWQHAKSDRYHDDPLASDMALANLDDIFPRWRDGHTDTFVLQGEKPDPRPWPKDPVEQLVWLCTSNARPWIPTSGELDRLAGQRRRRANPMPEFIPGRPDRQDKSRKPSKVIQSTGGSR